VKRNLPSPLKAVNEANSVAILMEQRDEKTRQAYELRRSGLSWFEVAKRLQSTEGAVRKMVADEMREAAAAVSQEKKLELLAMELDRIDTLQAAHWAMALADVREGEFVLKLILERIKLLDLGSEATSVTNNTLVVAGTSEEYVAALRAIANGGA
jgi:hypothetical protein